MAEAKAQNRYRVIERLESGGMAEVFRGEAESLAGFKKSVAIKRVLPHLAQNERFIRMFLDEARLCARLNHTNIVQVFDIGHVENTYFIVMEFVDGVNLKAVIEYLRKRNQAFPVGIAVQICIQICSGLQYAHDLTDSDGSTLNIVHRDMSPPNVLISKRGEVKIVDFGLAKAAMSVEKTDPGVVKGKFGYLAPETASGKDADPQADIFAVGIILWEMLAGRRLFFGDSDFQTVKLVQQANVPSLSKLNPDVPKDLEAIIAQALAKEKAARYASGEAMASDLARFLASHQISVVQFDVAKLVKDVIEEKRAQKKHETVRDGSIIDRLIQEELMRFTSLEGEAAAAAAAAANAGGATSAGLGAGASSGKSEDFVNTSDWASDVLGDFDLGGGGLFGEEPAPQAEAQPEDLSPPQAPPVAVADEHVEELAGVEPEAAEAAAPAAPEVPTSTAVAAAPAVETPTAPVEASPPATSEGTAAAPEAGEAKTAEGTHKTGAQKRAEQRAERKARQKAERDHGDDAKSEEGATKSEDAAAEPTAVARPSATTAKLPSVPKPTEAATTGASAAQPERKPGGAVLAGVALVVLAGVGAVLWFAGVIPH